MDIPNNPKPAANPAAAWHMSQGRTLVPYWGRNKAGRRVACCVWMQLRPGESISRAAGRLNQRAG